MPLSARNAHTHRLTHVREGLGSDSSCLAGTFGEDPRTVRRLVFDVLTPSELAGFEVAVDKLLAATQAEDSTP